MMDEMCNMERRKNLSIPEEADYTHESIPVAGKFCKKLFNRRV